ncbi:MAG: hypothetical protein HY541_05590 [Deltaproteobacteria bacterium]|nr:hypothetical protein [Deltaproteobacteria bacterium]
MGKKSAKKFLFLLAGLFLGALPLWGESYDPPSGGEPPPRILSPAQNPGEGIYSHQVYSAVSQDTLSWTKEGRLLFDHASVPDAVIKGNTVFLYFMDAGGRRHVMSVAQSSDGGKTWNKSTVAITGKQMPGDSVDPNPLLSDSGRIRLFYMSGFGPPVPGQNHQDAEHCIDSALSDDGIHFQEEKGHRFCRKGITDPDVVRTKDGWKMFVSFGEQNLSTTSTDGMTFIEDSNPASTNGSVSRTIPVDGGYRMFKCSRMSGIASQFTTDFVTWKDEGVRLRADNNQIMCDPGVVRLSDGTYKMFYKTMPVKFKPLQPVR